MCGISGWFVGNGSPFAAEHLRAMQASLHHRGPDDSGTFLEAKAGVGLASNRLAILDLSELGRQPMIGESGLALVYNGELYNFRALRAELESIGHRFRSRCDTEVLLRSLEQWGARAVEKLDGMFAFAAWSPRERSLLLARDPMGVKPLYYWVPPGGQGVTFASELKAFLGLPGFRAEVDPTALRYYLEFGYCFDPDRTILRGVFKLPPGHVLTVDDKGPGTPARYFDPLTHASAPPLDPHECEERLYATLREVVSQHLAADVPVGLLLSGGIDSSLIAALAAREGHLRTFSMGFAASEVDERPFARLVSQHIGSRHREFLIGPEDVQAEIEESVPYFDDLFGDWGLVTTRLLYRRCRDEGVKVVVVGEGADELFGGYPVFRAFPPARAIVPTNWRLFQLYRCYAGRRYGRLFDRFRRRMREYLRVTAGDFFGAVRLFESRDQLPNNYVMKVDKASMSVSVEARVPYLDPRVAALAYQIPGDQLLRNGMEKHVLRSIAARHRLLPREVLERRKFGAAIAASWMDDSERFRTFAGDVILDRGSYWTDALRLRRAMTEYFLGGRSGYPFPSPLGIFRNVAWRLLLLCLWSRHYVGRPA